MVVSPQSGIVIVKAAPASLFMVEKYLRASELISVRQVMLEAKILEVQLNDGFQAGINWATLQHNGKTAIGVNGLNAPRYREVTSQSGVDGDVGQDAGRCHPRHRPAACLAWRLMMGILAR